MPEIKDTEEALFGLNQMEEFSKLLVTKKLDETKVVLETRVLCYFSRWWLHLTYKGHLVSLSDYT